MSFFGLFNKLPKPGADFSFSDPETGFEEKLKDLIRHSANFRNLDNNFNNIISVLREYGSALRSGGLSFWQKKSALEKIKEADNNLTVRDLKDVKMILEKLSKRK